MDSVSTAHVSRLPERLKIRSTVILTMCTLRTTFGWNPQPCKVVEFIPLSESVQRNGQIRVAIFTHERCSRNSWRPQERPGTTVNSRSASILSARGGGGVERQDKGTAANH